MTFNIHLHRQIVLQVTENIAQNKIFVKYKIIPVSKIPQFDGSIWKLKVLFKAMCVSL